MKHIKKTASFLLALCLAISALCISVSALDGEQTAIYSISLWTAERSIQLPAYSIAVNSYPSSGSFTFPSLGESETGLTIGRPGFAFIGWKSEDDNTVYQPGDVIEVTKDLNFYGQWTATYPFTDLDEDANYFYKVIDVYEQGLMTGISETVFSPDGTFTRAMLWTLLARMNGVETGGSPWYAQAQTWAVENGISDGTFPDRAVTRQELAAMLYRQAGSPDTYDDMLKMLDTYPGADQVENWARNAVWWALNTRVLDLDFTDPSDTVVNAGGAATRAEVASAVVQFSQLAAGSGTEAETE